MIFTGMSFPSVKMDGNLIGETHKAKDGNRLSTMPKSGNSPLDHLLLGVRRGGQVQPP
jgi:hypothetical protein